MLRLELHSLHSDFSLNLITFFNVVRLVNLIIFKSFSRFRPRTFRSWSIWQTSVPPCLLCQHLLTFASFLFSFYVALKISFKIRFNLAKIKQLNSEYLWLNNWRSNYWLTFAFCVHPLTPTIFIDLDWVCEWVNNLLKSKINYIPNKVSRGNLHSSKSKQNLISVETIFKNLKCYGKFAIEN